MKQYQSETIKELSAALAKAQGIMKHAEKSVTNTFYKSAYADLPAVIDAAKSALSENGLSVVQITDIQEDGKIILITQLNHSAGEWMRGYYPINPTKNDPQGLGSAVTYARRYAFCAIAGVAAINEDDDGNAASGNTSSEKPDKEPKSVFTNANLRNTFTNNVIKSFESSETVEEANTVAQLNKAKMDEMRASGNSHDLLAADELSKRYKQRLVAIKEQEHYKQMQEDFAERA